MTKLVLLLILLMPLWAYGAEGEAKKPAEPSAKKSDDKVVNIGEVSERMAVMWCDKLAECTTSEEMGPKECRKVLKKSFQDGFKNVPEGQKIEVKSSGLSQCSESIKQNTCDALKSAQTLPGCEFISQLNRS
jgi:hypothetical protein